MRFLTLFLLTLATNAVAAEPKSPPPRDNENGESRYVSSTKRYSVPVPAGWRNVSGETVGLRENVMLHPKRVQGFACNMVFIEETIPRKMGLSETTDASISNIRKILPEFEVIERKEIKGTDGILMERVKYTGRFLPNGVKSKNVAYIIPLGDDRLLTITVSGIESTPDGHADEADVAIKRISFTK